MDALHRGCDSARPNFGTWQYLLRVPMIGKVYCLNAVTGQPVWVMRVGPKDDRLLSRGEMISRWPVRTGVLIDGETAYFGAGVFPHEMIYLCAVNALSGDVIWRNDTISEQNAGRNDLTPQGYLLSNKENLFVPSGRSLPVAVSQAGWQHCISGKVFMAN